MTFTSSLTDFGGRRSRGAMALLTLGTSTLGAGVGSGIEVESAYTYIPLPPVTPQGSPAMLQNREYMLYHL